MAEYSLPKDYKFYDALTSFDGRFRSLTEDLAEYFSEKAVIKNRVQVEIEYLIFMCAKVVNINLTEAEIKSLRRLYQKFSNADAEAVIKIDLEINHDTKAVELFIGDKLRTLKMTKLITYVHFCLTSADADNNAASLSLQSFLQKVYLPETKKLLAVLGNLAKSTRSKVILGRTHGQPAVPTTMGKELTNFAVRVKKRLDHMQNYQVEGKVGGAVGNYNAHVAAFPELDWPSLSAEFIKSLGLRPFIFNTQILPYDNYIHIFQQAKLLNYILIGLAQDIWRYISDDYLLQKVNAKEVGSSTMPQKVNPIDFEMAESYLTLANGLFTVFENKLTANRLQRDLVDKYLAREIGPAWAATVVAYRSLQTGFSKLTFNEAQAAEILNDHWEIITEGIQTILRFAGDPEAYDKLKAFSRGKVLDASQVKVFIDSLKVSKEIKKRLLALSPATYTGAAEKLVDLGLKFIAEK